MSRTARPRLVAIGDNCLDAFLDKDLMTLGGNALNVAVHWRRAGWDACYFGAVGSDPEGELLLAGVAAAGLAPDELERRCGDTAVTLLRDDAGDRRFVLEALGVGAHYLPAPQRYARAAAANWVHLGTHANPELLRRLLADAVPFSVDVSTAPFALPLSGVPLVFGSARDAEPVAPLLAALRAAGARQVVLTCGRSGACFDDGTRLWHVAAVPVEVVDTCGAGDSFIATFITALHFERRSAGQALALAARAAARTCAHLGGFPQTPRPIPDWLAAKYAAAIDAGQGR